MTETPPQEEYDPAMARRVMIAGGVALVLAFAVIGLSALTLKADQVDDIPRAPLPDLPETPKPVD